jgi:signal transduction histidine kinase
VAGGWRRPAAFLRRHTLLAGFAAALVPLLALLSLQYVWLVKLERVTAIAHQAALQNSLESIGTQIQSFYRTAAYPALNLPSAIFTLGRPEKAAAFWKKGPVEGARRLFLVDFTHSQYGNYFIYDPAREKLESAPASDESLAIILAATPWQVLVARSDQEESATVRVDERDPENRILIRPIVDEGSHVVGLAGMILDEEYFRRDLLPQVVDRTLASYFPDEDPAAFAVMVMDAGDRTVLTLGDADGTTEAVRKRFPFVFTDWTVVLRSRSASPERWARASFAFNLGLSALLAAALLGGIVLALRAADRAMRLSEMKSNFVSNVSHELRTPLASIRVFGEHLRSGRAAAPGKAQEYGEYIEAESRRLSRLIDNILDFARIESGRKTYRFAPWDVEGLVAAVLESFKTRVGKDGYRVTFDRPAEPIPPATLDPDAIGQALNNLLDNAVKYSDGAKEIGVSLAREGGSVLISVRDQGIGIPREEQRKIFDRFHRVSTGLVHDVKGSGLGLSIVHHIVLAHGGDVSLKSAPGEGSTFTIRLPLARRPPEEPAEPGTDGGPGPRGASPAAPGRP